MKNRHWLIAATELPDGYTDVNDCADWLLKEAARNFGEELLKSGLLIVTTDVSQTDKGVMTLSLPVDVPDLDDPRKYAKHLTIRLDIPESYIEHFQSDRFQDSLRRLIADSGELAGNYERELCDMLIKAFHEAVICHPVWVTPKPAMKESVVNEG